MNILLSCIGRRGYIAEYLKADLDPGDLLIGTGNSEWTSGFKHCDLAVVLPDIYSPDYIPALIEICQQKQVDALLSFSDLDIDVLSRHLPQLREAGVLPIVTSSTVNEICFDKHSTYNFLKQHEFNTPETFISFEEAVKALETGRVSFPLFVKPRRGSGSNNLFKARNLKELDVFFHYAAEMLIQETISGQEHGFDICNDLKGNVLSVVPRRKLAMRSGETDRAETSDNPNLIEFGVRLGEKLGALGHVGPLDVDFFVDRDRIFVLELNPRFGGGYPLSHLAGADFSRLILKMAKGQNIEPQIGKYRPRVVMMKEYRILGGDREAILSNVCKIA
ncbi:MAG: ATP-grasp domain-containing protein [Cyanosarcina radialis HA8281-LM2]|jgi:carbamoyl-phosphate synthase large subunit|nr:ATP-grasp domain-containing protein [Cyanosarcina radialis HA8281-LM2]